MNSVNTNKEIIRVLRQNHITFAALFGSRAKGTAYKLSDYDILIATNPKTEFSLFDHADLKDKLETALETKVDLVTVDGLNPHMRDSVIKSMKVLYDERKR